MVQSPIVVESAWGADRQRQDYIRKELRLEWLQTKASRSFSKPSSVELLTIGWLGSAYFGSGLRLEPSLAEPQQHYLSSMFHIKESITHTFPSFMPNTMMSLLFSANAKAAGTEQSSYTEKIGTKFVSDSSLYRRTALSSILIVMQGLFPAALLLMSDVISLLCAALCKKCARSTLQPSKNNSKLFLPQTMTVTHSQLPHN